MANKPNWTTFKHLPVGHVFTFSCEDDVTWQGAKGPWIKTTRLTYRELREGDPCGPSYKVGFPQTRVEPIR